MMAQKTRWVRFQIPTSEGLRGSVVSAASLGPKLQNYLKNGIVVYEHVYSNSDIARVDGSDNGQEPGEAIPSDGQPSDA